MKDRNKKRRSLLSKRNAMIRKDYKEMRAKNKYRTTYILETLGAKYFLDSDTIYDIATQQKPYNY